MYIKVEHFSETSSLQFDLVWKCIVHDDQKITFVHCQSGIILDFDNDQPVPIPSTHNNEYTDIVSKIRSGESAFQLKPLKHNESVHNTLLREADFHLQKQSNGSTTIVDSYSDKTIDTSDPNKRPGEARFNTAPELKDQSYIDADKFDLSGADITRFKLVPEDSVNGDSIFSVVKLEASWKHEIELGQSISSIIVAHYYKYINPWNTKENNIYNCEYFKLNLMYKENIKIFTLLHDYLTNVPPDQISPHFSTGKVVKLR